MTNSIGSQRSSRNCSPLPDWRAGPGWESLRRWQLWSSFIRRDLALRKLPCLNLPIGGHSDPEAIYKLSGDFSGERVDWPTFDDHGTRQFVQDRSLAKVGIEKVFYGGEHVSDEMRQFFGTNTWSVNRPLCGLRIVDAGTIGYQCDTPSGLFTT